jgi:hypothetical protein
MRRLPRFIIRCRGPAFTIPLSGPAYTTRRMPTFTPTKPAAPRAGELARPPESKAKLGGKSIGDRTPAMTAAGSIPSLTTNGRLMGQAP